MGTLCSIVRTLHEVPEEQMVTVLRRLITEDPVNFCREASAVGIFIKLQDHSNVKKSQRTIAKSEVWRPTAVDIDAWLADPGSFWNSSDWFLSFAKLRDVYSSLQALESRLGVDTLKRRFLLLFFYDLLLFYYPQCSSNTSESAYDFLARLTDGVECARKETILCLKDWIRRGRRYHRLTQEYGNGVLIELSVDTPKDWLETRFPIGDKPLPQDIKQIVQEARAKGRIRGEQGEQDATDFPKDRTEKLSKKIRRGFHDNILIISQSVPSTENSQRTKDRPRKRPRQSGDSRFPILGGGHRTDEGSLLQRAEAPTFLNGFRSADTNATQPLLVEGENEVQRSPSTQPFSSTSLQPPGQASEESQNQTPSAAQTWAMGSANTQSDYSHNLSRWPTMSSLNISLASNTNFYADVLPLPVPAASNMNFYADVLPIPGASTSDLALGTQNAVVASAPNSQEIDAYSYIPYVPPITPSDIVLNAYGDVETIPI